MIEILSFNISIWQFILITYLLVINLITFFIFAIDKFKATRFSRRVSEKKLWFFSLIGGSVGALISMNLFRHKTKKLSFQAVLALVILLQVFVIYYIIT